MSMKESIKAHGGLFSCAFTTVNGLKRSNVHVRAQDAKEARARLEKVLGCALAAFTVQSFVC